MNSTQPVEVLLSFAHKTGLGCLSTVFLNVWGERDTLRRVTAGPPLADTTGCHGHEVMSDYIGHSRHGAEQYIGARPRAGM